MNKLSRKEKIAYFWDAEANIGVDPEMVDTRNRATEYAWKCPKVYECCGKPHKWRMSPGKLLARHSSKYCPHCTGSQGYFCNCESLAVVCPDLAAEFRADLNGGQDPINIHHLSDIPVWWECKKKEGRVCDCPHLFEQSPRLRGGEYKRGCPYCCSAKKKLCIHESLFSREPEFMKDWDYELNEKEELDPKKLLPTSGKHANWIHISSKGEVHRWKCSIDDRISKKTGCQKCKTSKGEKIIEDELIQLGIEFEMQKKFEDCKCLKALPFDFYLPNHNILIEYDGLQHFKAVDFFGGESGFIRRQICDQIKDEYAKKSGIKLVRIKYNDDIIMVLNGLF